MLLVYCDRVTPRVRYAVDLLLREVLLFHFEITCNADEFSEYQGPKISYADKKKADGVHITADKLLFQSGVKQIKPGVTQFNGHPVIFPTSTHSGLPYDPFAATFFMVSRYEEYLPHSSDHHQRFVAEDSLAYRHQFLDKPIVHLWAEDLRQELLRVYPQLRFETRTFSFVNTIDIDNAWAYKQKGILRTAGGMGRSILQGKLGEVKQRQAVLRGKTTDPYDTFEYILQKTKSHNLTTICFFLLADYGVNDKNVPVTSRQFRSLIKYIADYVDVGIHPSYGSNQMPQKLPMEVGRLADITKRTITSSRQHFLRLTFPETYRRLIAAGITDDYTMGYASQTGFRSGMCHAYYHYDIDEESLTKLRVHPFAAMDGTLNEYLNLEPDAALQRIKELMAETKKYGGTYVSLWHNETLNDKGKWKGWLEVYEKSIAFALDV